MRPNALTTVPYDLDVLGNLVQFGLKMLCIFWNLKYLTLDKSLWLTLFQKNILGIYLKLKVIIYPNF